MQVSSLTKFLSGILCWTINQPMLIITASNNPGSSQSPYKELIRQGRVFTLAPQRASDTNFHQYSQPTKTKEFMQIVPAERGSRMSMKAIKSASDVGNLDPGRAAPGCSACRSTDPKAMWCGSSGALETPAPLSSPPRSTWSMEVGPF